MDFHRKRTGVLIFGSCLVLIGVICNVWLLSKVFSPDGTLILPTRILIWSFDILCVCCGLFLIYRRNVLALGQLSVLLVSLVFCLMIADWYLASRIFAEFYLHRRNPNGTGSYRLIPNLEIIRKIGRTTYVIKTNSHGMHWREVSHEKGSGKFRVAFVGDSFTFGCCADRVENSFVGVFDSSIDRSRYETLNFGISGYGLADEELQIREDVLPFKPDAIILIIYTGNDFSETYLSIDERNRVRETVDRRAFINAPDMPSSLKEGIPMRLVRSISDSAIFFLLGTLWEKDGQRSIPITEFQVEQDFNSRTYWSQSPYPPVAVRSVELYLEILERIRKLCVDNNIPLILAVIPYREQVYSSGSSGSDYNIELPQSFVETFAKRNAIPYVDLLAPLRAYVRQENRDPYFQSDPHLNFHGHQAVGKYLTNFFLANISELQKQH